VIVHHFLLAQRQRSRAFWGIIALLTACATVVLVLTCLWAVLHGELAIGIFFGTLAILFGHAGNTAERQFIYQTKMVSHLSLLVALKQQSEKNK